MNFLLENNTRTTGKNYYFAVEVGPQPKTFENYMKRVFAGVGLRSENSIKAFDKFTGQAYFRYMVDNAKNNTAVAEAVRNSKGKIIKITVQVSPAIIEKLRRFGIKLLISDKGRATFHGYAPTYEQNVKKHQNFTPAPETPVSQWTTIQKLDSVIRRAALLLPESVGNQLLALLEPWTLVAMAAVLGVWVVGHFFIASQIADAILLIVGGIFLGMAAFQAGEHLVNFAIKCVDGKTSKDLDDSAKHLAEAVALIGVQVVMALLLAKAPKVLGEPRRLINEQLVKPLNYKTVGEPPTSSKVFFENYEGKLLFNENSFAGIPGEMAGGSTSAYGDIFITYAKNAKIEDINVAFFHERVHRFLIPRLQVFKFLRQTFAILKNNSYLKSYILRYLEEALAETVGQIKGNGWRNFFVGVRFPINKGYVTFAKMGTEVTGTFLGPINVGGITYNVYYNFTDK